MKKAIVIGATSGIGKELAKILSQDGYAVGITGRRTHLLEALQAQLSPNSIARQIDVSDTPAAINILEGMI